MTLYAQPNDMLRLIFSYLNIKDTVSVTQTCKRFYTLVDLSRKVIKFQNVEINSYALQNCSLYRPYIEMRPLSEDELGDDGANHVLSVGQDGSEYLRYSFNKHDQRETRVQASFEFYFNESHSTNANLMKGGTVTCTAIYYNQSLLLRPNKKDRLKIEMELRRRYELWYGEDYKERNLDIILP